MRETRIRTDPHDWHIDERECRRQKNHRGRRFAYPDLDPRRTALVVIDMVPFHVAETPTVAEFCRTRRIPATSISTTLRTDRQRPPAM
ncbi:hypothetical protein [Nocardia fusca]|uniref:hypothetical protein n=1 Tax=Nocardia fusca TaxID=941183 RepID=UPI000A9588A4|nr:hypothetical protein [Nocardia fusca]